LEETMNLMTKLGGALVVAAALAGPAAAQGLQDVTIAHTPSLIGGVPKIAQELGLFEKHGFNATLVQMESANATATGLISGSVDATITGPGELIAAAARGVEMMVVANVYNGLNGSIVLSKEVADRSGIAPDAPVEERLKVLDGLTIGSTSATSAFTVSTRGAIERVGASATFTYMGQPTMQAALESGAVQAIMAGAPFWVGPVLNETGIIWVSGPRGEFPPDLMPRSPASLMVMRPLAESDPDMVERLGAVFVDLAMAVAERPDEVKTAIGRAFPTIDAATIEVLYEVEKHGLMARPLTVEDIAHEIAYVKLGGADLPGIDSIDPAALLFAR